MATFSGDMSAIAAYAASLAVAHDPEKRIPVFGKGHGSPIN